MDRRRAAAETKRWAGRNVASLRNKFEHLEADPIARAYCEHTVECFWRNHVEMHGTLFTPEFIPQSARILGCTELELAHLCTKTADVTLVEQWARDGRRSEDARLAERAYWLAVLIRGRTHEHLAISSGLQLMAHPYRRPVERKLHDGFGKPVLRSEELFVRMLIGAALLERTAERRITTWVDGLRRSRDAVLAGAIALPDTVLDSHAERFAASAARTLGIAGHSRILARAVDVTVSLGVAQLIALTVSPWLAPADPVAVQTYRYVAGMSAGDQLTRLARSTRANFRALARLVPGRIERHLRSE